MKLRPPVKQQGGVEKEGGGVIPRYIVTKYSHFPLLVLLRIQCGQFKETTGSLSSSTIAYLALDFS